MEAFQAWTECHEHSEVFLRLQGAWNNRLRPVTAPAPSVCWSCQLQSPPACSWISIDHVTSEVFAVLAEIGGIPPSPWPWSAVEIGSTSIWTRLTSQKKRAEDGSMDKSRKSRVGLKGGMFFALSSAVVVTFNRKETLIGGKVHVVRAADGRGRSALESWDLVLSLHLVCGPHVCGRTLASALIA